MYKIDYRNELVKNNVTRGELNSNFIVSLKDVFSHPLVSFSCYEKYGNVLTIEMYHDNKIIDVVTFHYLFDDNENTNFTYCVNRFEKILKEL